MARRTATITRLRYWKKYERTAPGVDKAKDVSNLPDGGDLLTFVYGVWRGLEPQALWDRSKQFYCNPEPQPAVAGRTVLFRGEIGSFGDPSSIQDTQTSVEALANPDGNLTNAVPQRLVLLVPQHATTAFLVIEHVPGGLLGQRFLTAIKGAWAQAHPQWTLEADTLTRSEAWLQMAELSAIEAEIPNHSADLADAHGSRQVGTLRVQLVPPEGHRFFPKAIRKAIDSKALSRSELLGTTEEPGELKVTLGDGDQSKTFILGKDKTPPVRMLVTDYNDTMLTDAAFRTWCATEAVDYFGDVGVAWNTQWNRGAWTDAQRSTRVVITDEQQGGGTAPTV